MAKSANANRGCCGSLIRFSTATSIWRLSSAQHEGRAPAQPEIHAAIDLIESDHFSRNERGVFRPLLDMLLDGDRFMHLADLTAYVEAHERVERLHADPDAWTRKAIANVAASGRFSSDRTIAEYAAEIWKVEPCPVP